MQENSWLIIFWTSASLWDSTNELQGKPDNIPDPNPIDIESTVIPTADTGAIGPDAPMSKAKTINTNVFIFVKSCYKLNCKYFNKRNIEAQVQI